MREYVLGIAGESVLKSAGVAILGLSYRYTTVDAVDDDAVRAVRGPILPLVRCRQACNR